MTTNDEMLLHSMTALVSAHGKAISRFGASVVVMTKFVEAVLPQLSTPQIERTIQAFRAQLGEAMAVADDVRLPGEYRTTLIEQANVLLARLGGEPAGSH
ncbi:hypothetical protein [Paraburkholderia unamae]|uniref:Uncharacterized protein n=1 Tax=Paraburkholderia unamae TaxID=219649 RepID=A0ABX5KQQ8_9BURK|nr:hypothetical protein [Paraburkholderia unamae]PVX85009.1 hypothetical protein C7402_104252 [Paraburkholderia unamae]RAR65896.1 hypothetical protein C7401_103203 [Paraburkholderia unamae]CAG9266903.1 conserved hypothetical protein [Paraburkholderia unamae]